MKRMISTLALPLLFLVMSMPLFAQNKTYMQVTKTCLPLGCDSAEFTPTATLSYSILHAPNFMAPFQNQDATWNGVLYTDFTGSFSPIEGARWAQPNWRMVATFDGGRYTVIEDFACFRYSCGLHSNTSGTVTGP